MPETNTPDIRGSIFEIQRFSIHDGPGIRTTVFMKGCPLRCIWCHNPEAISSRPSLAFDPRKCIGCGYCFRVCPRGAHRMAGVSHELERARCEVCGKCTEECYAHALEFVGREISVGEVMAEVLRDRPFYETSGGGMTLSGGEPTFQFDFALGLLKAARSYGLHTAVQTCGYAEPETVEALMPLVDLFMVDIKETDPDKHIAFTGVPLKRIQQNLRMLHDSGAKVVMRSPVIPGCNEREDFLAGIENLAKSLPNLVGVELMTYNPLGESKVERFGLDSRGRAGAARANETLVARWCDHLREAGVPVVNEKPHSPSPQPVEPRS
ncbi:MAG TPA: glycyl-radical enzyme activating protein [Candidatus Hydrogenedentes bacterium]|nr:glycyl-radical enzyme activating protein [Candidatus Hydrogenedentota bacterium]HQE84696.1 glycyl-radical enzyme activating protein [Candidatus Hydrogenedentota bacterium]HQH52634.1 glycyl-radical enzyme activating protein [Candidatus Hydrogenedentota bacterium]HQM47093.1 glycyl-radical enzyme activating protein [Candidatus Hydrogenedentota bacterium]